MKEKLNNAMNDISDKLVEEAVNATHLENKTLRIVRNIALPVAGVAAAAGLCFGLAKLGVFDKNSVDLVSPPSQSGTADSGSSTISETKLEDIFRVTVPSKVPLAAVAIEHTMELSIDRNAPANSDGKSDCASSRPEILYADSDRAIITDGSGGVYEYNMKEDKVTFSADINATADVMVRYAADGAPESFFSNSERITKIFADNEGELYAEIYYSFPLTSSGKGYSEIDYQVSQQCLYRVNKEDGYMSRVENIPPANEYLIPVDHEVVLSSYCANIKDTEHYVYLEKNNFLENVEQDPLRQISLVYSYDKKGGKEVIFYPFVNYNAGFYDVEEAYAAEDGLILQLNSDKSFEIYEGETMYAGDGEYRVIGDILVLRENALDHTWLYRIIGNGSGLVYAEGFAEQMEANPDHPASFLNGKHFTSLEIPKSGNSMAAFCDKVQMANEPDAILSIYDSYHIGIKDEKTGAVGDSWYGNGYGTDGAKNMFFTDAEGLVDVTASGAQHKMVISQTAEDINNNYTLKKYRVDAESYLITSIEIYNVDNKGEQTLLTTINFGYSGAVEKSEYSDKDEQLEALQQELESFIVVLQLMQDDPYEKLDDSFDEDINSYLDRLVKLEEETKMLVKEKEAYLDEQIDIMSDKERTDILAERQLLEARKNKLREQQQAALDILKEYEELRQTKLEVEYSAKEQNEYIAQLIADGLESYPVETAYDINDMRWPLDEKHQNITSYFGYDSWRGGTHYGIDIADADIGGESVFAAQGGRVIAANNSVSWSGGLGNYVIIGHGNGYATLYSQCKEVYVSAGDTVEKGQVIAAVGTTGWSTGNHLHFEVRSGFAAVDPFNYKFSYGTESTSTSNTYYVIADAAAKYSGEYILPENRKWCLDSGYTEIIEEMYGNGGYYGHKGVDIYAPDGAAVYAMADGEVIHADWINGYGYCAIIAHEGGYFTLYAHNSALLVSKGDKVAAGQQIAQSGSTGITTGEHLHLEVYRGAENVDPKQFFPADISVTPADFSW